MDAVPIAAVNVVVAELDDEIALLLPDSGDTLLLNPSAARIWLACDGVRPVSSVVAHLGTHFPGVDDLPRQVEDTVDDLVRRGFLVWRDDRLAPSDGMPATPRA